VSNIRYGVYMRPDPATCWTVTQITTALRAQYGLISAGAFPPHATLVGNLATDASADEVIAAVDPVLKAAPAVEVFNAGIVRVANCYEYDINLDVTGRTPNQQLGTLATNVIQAVLPLSKVADDSYTVQVEDFAFSAHLGLASHDLKVDSHLSDEVGEFLSGLPLTPPRSFLARWYSAFEFQADDWTGEWWKSLTWKHLRSWNVPSRPSASQATKQLRIQ